MKVILQDNLENITEADWDALLLQSSSNTIFQTYGWHKAWLEAFKGQIETVYIISVFADDRLKGIAPLMIVRKRGRIVLKFMGADRSDYLDFIYPKEEEAVLSVIIDFLATNQDQWDEVVLENIPDYSLTHQYLEKFCQLRKLRCLNFSCIPCPTLLLHHDQEELKKILNKKSLIRHQKYFLKKEGYKVLHLDDQEEILQFLDQFFQQHIERRAVTEISSLFLDDKNRVFYKKLVQYLSAKKQGVLTVVISEGCPIAFHFGFIYNKKIIWYKPAFDIDLFKKYPGEVLLKELMEYAVIKNLEEFDFALGMESFKERFSNEVRENFSYKIFKSSKEYWFYKIFAPLSRWKAVQQGRVYLEKLRTVCGPLGEGFWASLGQRFFKYSCVYLYAIDSNQNPSEDIETPLVDFTIREAGIKDLYKFDFFTLSEQKQRFLSTAFERLKRGDHCFIGECKEGVVAITWTTDQEEIFVAEVETKINNDNTLVIFDCVTVPKYRGKNIYSYMLFNLIKVHSDQKKMIYCEEKNEASRKGIEKNFELVKKLYLLKFFGLNLKWRR